MRNIALFICLALPASVHAYSTGDEQILNRRIKKFEVIGATDAPWFWMTQFLMLCRTADVPCGIAFPNREESEMEGPLKGKRFKNVPLKVILDFLVAEYPRYRWIIDKGVINIVPLAVLESRNVVASPLDRRLKSVDIVEKRMSAAAVKICRKAGLGCPPLWLKGGIDGGIGERVESRKITLHLSDVSFREALNALVRKDGHAIWSFTQGETPNLGLGEWTPDAP